MTRDTPHSTRGCMAVRRLTACVLATASIVAWSGVARTCASAAALHREERGPPKNAPEPEHEGKLAQASRSVTGPCAGVLHWLRHEGEEGWLRRCQAAGGGRGMTYGGATHSCREWIAICRQNPGYLGGPVRSR